MKIRSLTNVLALAICLLASTLCRAQSPEISLREFASGQIKKGVRSIGMGGDGATWGNYSLVWRDSASALLDAGVSAYNNSNSFSFTAVGFTTPTLWHGLAIYAIALSQNANNIGTSLKSPGLGSGPVRVHGDGSNEAVFVKAAMPLGKGFSVGVLVSYERSQFNALSDNSAANYVRYKTNWLPSGGFGVSWQPNGRILVGLRGLFNHDNEVRTDNTGSVQGLNLAHEYRAGVSVGLWQGALIDVGGNLRYRYNHIYNTKSTDVSPNLGFEQTLLKKHLSVRAGLDESSGTAGFSLRSRTLILDVAYVYNLGIARIKTLFGDYSNSVLATFTFNYAKYHKKH